MSSTNTTLGRVGIDKSNLSTRDFRLSDSLRLTHKPPLRIALDPRSLSNSQDVGSIPWGIDSLGRELTGSYFLNLPSGVGVDLSSKGLLLNLNPSRVICKNEPTFLVTKKSEMITTRELVQKELDQLGIDVDVFSMNVCRLDPSKQVNTIDHASRYQSVGQMISASRVKGRQYDTAFTIGNGQRQFIFYSKHDHLLFHKHQSNNPHLGRAELKLLNSKVVNSTLGVTTFQSLLDLDIDFIECQFHNVVNSFVFSNKVDPSTICQVDFDTEFTLYNTHYKGIRNGHNKYLGDLGIRYILENFGSVSNFGTFLDKVGVPRSTRYRVVGQLKDKVFHASLVDTKRKTMSTLDKYNELHRNFGIAV